MNNPREVLIGSYAAKQWFPDFRETADFDYLVDGPRSHNKTLKIEYYDKNLGDGLNYIYNNGILEDDNYYIAGPSDLYTLKVSHVFWKSHLFAKTMADIEFFQKKGVPFNYTLFKMLYSDWERIHGKKKISLNKTNEMFFQDAVERQYEHDDIHRAIAYYDEPMYERVKPDRSKAMISESMFNYLSYEDKLKLCREEIYVTAIERYLLPNDWNYGTLAAYRHAVELLITSMTKGFFPLWIVLNWVELKRPDINFVDKFKTNFSGKVMT